MRKEAINVFTEGLIKDLHPINTPNNVLTDALNATLLTYDGNEYILQNDVGNGRVETAKLPAGYVPIGIKEYGGIIYVASYNPINGKSQLGSFPSPERQISTEELSTKYGINTTVNTNNAYVRLDIIDDNKKSLYKLNPGDKFLIASSGINNLFNNYQGILKIHVGVVDKENNITYIEDDLKDPYILDTTDIETNTNYQVFTSKTSGYLTIIIELESIDTFNVTRDINIIGVDKVTDETLVNPEFYLQFNGNYTSSSKIDVKQFSIDINSTKYYSTEDLKFRIEDIRKTDKINYEIVPYCQYGALNSFAVSGSIDFSTMGTGFTNLTEWRYYVDNDYLKLNWGLDYDPIKYVKINEISFSFYDVLSGCTAASFKSNSSGTTAKYVCGSKDNYNGNFSEKIPFINKTTPYGLLKNRLYFVIITINYVNEGIDSIVLYRMVNTTGQYNEQYIQYVIKDFKDLYLNADITIDPQFEITKVTTTPITSAIMSNSVTLSNPFTAINSVYNVSGKFNANYKLVTDNYFGNFNAMTKVEESDDTSNKGLVVKLPTEFESIKTSDTPRYLGTSLSVAEELENKLLEKYPDGRGIIDKSSIKFHKTNNDSLEFSLGGEVRRGLYVTGSNTETVTNDCYVLKPAVSSISEFLTYYITCDLIGTTPNDFKGSTNHLQASGRTLAITSDAKLYLHDLGNRGSNGLPISSKEADWEKNFTNVQTKVLNNAFELSSVNGITPNSVPHPISILIPDNHKENGGIGYEKGGQGHMNNSFGAKRKVDDKFIDDYIMIAWKSADQSWAFVNIGGIIAWPNDEVDDPLAPNAKYNKDNCSSEYPALRGGIRLTSMDILYYLLSNLYIAQWDSNSTSVQVLDYNSIVYHDSFDTNFEIGGTFEYTCDPNKLFSFDINGIEHYINEEDISNIITSKFNIERSILNESISKNVTVKTNLQSSGTMPWTLDYSVGSTLSMSECYNRLTSLIINKQVFNEDSVYIKGTESSVDGNNNTLSTNTIYVKDSSGNYVQYNGTNLVYPSGKTTNTSNNFFKIFRPSDRTKKPVIYINPTKQIGYAKLQEGKDETLLKIDVNIIYPEANMWI